MNVTENTHFSETENRNNLLVAGTEDLDTSEPTTFPADERQAMERPPGVPEKFWDAEANQLRTETLVKSYLELEKKLGSLNGRQPPSQPDDYQIDTKSEFLTNDPTVNERLHKAGFTQEQAQIVYDLASERLMPMVAEIASIYETEGQVSRLVQHFGSETRWQEASRQIEAWGRSRLPQQVFDALSTTYEGVLAMHCMMDNGEPGLRVDGAEVEDGLSEASLKAIMRDPRYWRDKDPAVVAQVREGFKKLYQE